MIRNPLSEWSCRPIHPVHFVGHNCLSEFIQHVDIVCCRINAPHMHISIFNFSLWYVGLILTSTFWHHSFCVPICVSKGSPPCSELQSHGLTLKQFLRSLMVLFLCIFNIECVCSLVDSHYSSTSSSSTASFSAILLQIELGLLLNLRSTSLLTNVCLVKTSS